MLVPRAPTGQPMLAQAKRSVGLGTVQRADIKSPNGATINTLAVKYPSKPGAPGRGENGFSDCASCGGSLRST
jgi:hypothetical protein